MALKMLPTLSQATGTDETERHAVASGNVIDPVVLVLSLYVPSALAMKVPVVDREPFTDMVGQPRLVEETSMSPDNARHEEVTFHVPTRSPPQAAPLLQFGAPPEPMLPPVPSPAVPLEPPEPLCPPFGLCPPDPAL
jgi:hypothetical protein